jgi:glycosyltransferase involved in cell wall biosynthesis
MEVGGVQKSLVNLLNEICSRYEITLFVFSRSGGMLNEISKEIKIIESKSLVKVLGMTSKDLSEAALKYRLFKMFLKVITLLVGSHNVTRVLVYLEPALTGFDYAVSYIHPSPRKMLYGGTNEFVLKRVRAKKKIGFVHCDFENHGTSERYLQKLYSNFDTIAFCSRGCLNSYKKVVNDSSQILTVVNNRHDKQSIINKSLKQPVFYDEDYFNVLIVSRVTYDKGVDIAIRAVAECINTNKLKMRLHIVGDGRDAGIFKALTLELGIGDSVTFYGNQTNPYRFMKNSSLLLLTSRHEAAPMVFGEAQILGIPVLATKTTSSQELVVSAGAGWECSGSVEDVVNSLVNITGGTWKLSNKNLVDSDGFHNKLSTDQFDEMIRRLKNDKKK